MADSNKVLYDILNERLELLRQLDKEGDSDRRRHIAKETAELHAKLAHRLGLYQIKTEMEDLALKFSQYDLYKYIAHALNEKKSERDDYIARFIAPIEEKLKNLYQLQSMLSEIDKIKTLCGELPLEVQDLEDEIEGLTTRIERLQADMTGLQEEISRRRVAIQDNNSNIERYTGQLDNVRNNREYENLTKEIEYLQLDNQLNEKKIREASAVSESKQEEIRRCSDTVTERRTDLDIKKSELDEIIAETRAEEEKLRERSKSLEATIEPRLLSSFFSAFLRLRRLGFSSVDFCSCTPASSGSIMMRPQYSQTMIFLRIRMSSCRWGGILLKQPPQASRST